MTEPTEVEYFDMPVRITPDGIFIGGHKIPGCIAKDGVTLKPGGPDGVNSLTIELLVGEVLTEDPTRE